MTCVAEGIENKLMQGVLVDRHKTIAVSRALEAVVATLSTPLSTRQKAKKNMIRVLILLAPNLY
jgi:hypothetical protein